MNTQMGRFDYEQIKPLPLTHMILDLFTHIEGVNNRLVSSDQINPHMYLWILHENHIEQMYQSALRFINGAMLAMKSAPQNIPPEHFQRMEILKRVVESMKINPPRLDNYNVFTVTMINVVFISADKKGYEYPPGLYRVID